ncbi:hypothetical protein ACN469_12650 [Corallococcus terminator]
MHEWLQALRKAAKAASSGVSADEVRWAETECGVPFPEDLGHLYLSFNGGEFHGDVNLFPLHGPEGSVSVLEKTRLKLEGLPAAGVWRIGMKGTHRHLFSARKSAMVEQGDGGGPLPGWVQSLGDEEWIFGTWEGEKREMRLYRSLKEMLDVLVPPAEVESFGERTFARALNAVLQGALSGVAVDDEEEAEEAVAEEVLVAAEEEEEEDEGAQRELAYEYDDEVSRGRKGDEGVGFGKGGAKVGGGKKAPSKVAVTQVELFVRPTMQEALRKELGPEKKGPKKKASVAPAEPVAKKTRPPAAVTPVEVKPVSAPQAEPVAKKPKAKKAATPVALAPATSAGGKAAGTKPAATSAGGKAAETKPAATKVPARPAVTTAPATKEPSKSGVTKVPVQKLAATKGPAKTPAAKKAPTTSAAKKPSAKKVPAKSAAKKAPAKAAAKKSAAKKAPAKAAAKKAPAKAAAKKSPAKKAPAKAAAKKSPSKAPAQKAPAKSAVKKTGTKKVAAKKAKSRR